MKLCNHLTDQKKQEGRPEEPRTDRKSQGQTGEQPGTAGIQKTARTARETQREAG